MADQAEDPPAGPVAVFARPTCPEEMEYAPRKRRHSKIKEMVVTFRLLTPTSFEYKSTFLEMSESPQTLLTRKASAKETLQRVRGLRNSPSVKINGPSNMSAQMGYWMLQHTVLILYDFDDIGRKQCAVECFPNDVVGRWCYPDGDLIVIPRESPDKPTELFFALMDLEYATWTLVSMNAPLGMKVIATDRNDVNFNELGNIKGKMESSTTLEIPLLFKPVFFPMYFKFEDTTVIHPKKLFMLDVLQKYCLVFFHLSDLATASKRCGSALLFAQGAHYATKLMDSLLQTDLLLAKLAYTHLIARHSLANAFYHLVTKFEDYTFERNNFYDTKRRCESGLNMLRTFEIDYCRETKTEASTTVMEVSREPTEAAREAVVHYSSLRLPGHWRRSSFRKELATILIAHYGIRNTLESKTSLTEKYSLQLKTEHLRKFERDLQNHRAEIKAKLTTTGFNSLLVINRLVNARCLEILAALDASRKMDSLFCEMIPLGEGGEENVVVETFGKEDRLTRTEYDLYKQMEGQHIETMKAFKALTGSQKKAARKQFIASMKQFLFDQIFFQIELEERQLEDGTPPCTVSNLLLAFQLAVTPFEDGISNESSEITSFHQMAAAFCFGMSRLFLIKHYSEHKSYRDRKQMWLFNSTYYHHLTAMYLREPGVGFALLHMVFNNAEKAKVIYTGGMQRSRQQPVRVICVLRRVMLMLPLLWEICIMQGIDSPVNYNEVLLKDFSLPCSLIDLGKIFSAPTYNAFKQMHDGLQLILSKSLKPYKIELTENSSICRVITKVKDELKAAYANDVLESENPKDWKGYCGQCAKKITLALMKVVEERVYGTQNPTIDIDVVATEASDIASFLMTQLYGGEKTVLLPKVWVLVLFSLCFSTLFAISSCNYFGEGAPKLYSRTQLCLYAGNPSKSPTVGECISTLLLDEPEYNFSTAENYHTHLSQAVSALMGNLNLIMLNGVGDENSFIPRNVGRLLQLLVVSRMRSSDIDFDATLETLASALVESVIAKFPVRTDGKTIYNIDRKEVKFCFPDRKMATPIYDEFSKTLNVAYAKKIGWKYEAPAVPSSTETQYDPLTCPMRNQPNVQVEGPYNPHANVDEFIKEDEKTCPDFGDDEVSETFERVLGDFHGDKNCTNYKGLVLDLAFSLCRTIYDMNRFLFKAEQRLATRFPNSLLMVTFDGHRKDRSDTDHSEIEMSDDLFHELKLAIDELMKSESLSLFTITRMLFKMDQLLFKGRNSSILRGHLPDLSSGSSFVESTRL